jgi:hypothetical protein
MKPLPLHHDDFRPSDGIFALPAETLLIASIKGASRRKMIEQATAEDRLEEVHPDFYESALSDAERTLWGRLHPRHLGGEFLPDRKRAELEIARITLDSTTQDVMCLYARRSGDRFVYRAVDEYSGQTLQGPTQFRRRRQLTQAELVQLLMQVYPLDEVCHGNDLTGDEAQAFCTPYSAYYPYFEERVRAYLAERCPAPEVEADAEEDEDDYEDDE